MVRIATALVVLGSVLVGGASARAQTPSDPYGVLPTIQREGGALAPCLTALALREDTPLLPHQPNLQGSGALGIFQFMPSTWSSTSVGQRVSLAAASVSEQVAAATELIMGGWISAWNPVPAPCG